NSVICVGIDGRVFQDQTAIAIRQEGRISIARKFHPTADEAGLISLAQDYLAPEDAVPRVFTVSDKKFYLCVCYDVFGIHHNGLNNPGVDAALTLAHRFCRKGEGMSGDVDFARKGLAGAAKQWACPVFGSVVFVDRHVPPNWPSGVLW